MEKTLAFFSLKHYHLPLLSLLHCSYPFPSSFGIWREAAQQPHLGRCGGFWRAQSRPLGRSSAAHKSSKGSVKFENEDDDDDYGDGGGGEKKSKGQKKREALRAVDWGKELASLSQPQLEKAIRWASLPEEVLDAAKLAKSINPKARSGKRRQFSYLGSLLRDVEPELMEMVIKASKHGEELYSPSLLRDDDLHGKEEDELLQNKNELGDKQATLRFPF